MEPEESDHVEADERLNDYICVRKGHRVFQIRVSPCRVRISRRLGGCHPWVNKGYLARGSGDPE